MKISFSSFLSTATLRVAVVTGSAFLSLGLSGCLAGNGIDESDVGVDSEVGESQLPLCIIPPNPTYDASVTLPSVNGYDAVDSPSAGYGSGECEYYAVRFVYGDRGSVTPYSAPTTEVACENTTVRAQFYTRASSSDPWTYQTSVTRTGIWSGGACTNITASANPGGSTAQLLIRGQVREYLPGSPISGWVNRRLTVHGHSIPLN